MDFEAIAKTCPWRRKIGLCSAISSTVPGAFGVCAQKSCAFWHWLYHLSVMTYHPKNADARILINKEDLPEATRKQLYPEDEED